MCCICDWFNKPKQVPIVYHLTPRARTQAVVINTVPTSGAVGEMGQGGSQSSSIGAPTSTIIQVGPAAVSFSDHGKTVASARRTAPSTMSPTALEDITEEDEEFNLKNPPDYVIATAGITRVII